jgi:hypothetical protein
MNVSERAVDRAKVVTEHGTSELQEAVKDGTVTLTDAAKIAHEPAIVQNRAVSDVKSGRAETASAAAKPKG